MANDGESGGSLVKEVDEEAEEGLVWVDNQSKREDDISKESKSHARIGDVVVASRFENCSEGDGAVTPYQVAGDEQCRELQRSTENNLVVDTLPTVGAGWPDHAQDDQKDF